MYIDLDSLYVSPEGLRFIESDHTLFGYKSLAGIDTDARYWFRKLSDTVVDVADSAVKKSVVCLVYEEDEKDGGCSCPFGTTWLGRDDSIPPERVCDGFSNSSKIGFPLSPPSLMLPL